MLKAAAAVARWVPKVVAKLLHREVLRLLLPRVVARLRLLRHREVLRLLRHKAVVASSSSKKPHHTEKDLNRGLFLCGFVAFWVVEVKRLVTSFVVVVPDLHVQSFVEYRLDCLSNLARQDLT